MVELMTGKKVKKLCGHFGNVNCVIGHPLEQVNSRAQSPLYEQTTSVKQPTGCVPVFKQSTSQLVVSQWSKQSTSQLVVSQCLSSPPVNWLCPSGLSSPPVNWLCPSGLSSPPVNWLCPSGLSSLPVNWLCLSGLSSPPVNWLCLSGLSSLPVKWLCLSDLIVSQCLKHSTSQLVVSAVHQSTGYVVLKLSISKCSNRSNLLFLFSILFRNFIAEGRTGIS